METVNETTPAIDFKVSPVSDNEEEGGREGARKGRRKERKVRGSEPPKLTPTSSERVEMGVPLGGNHAKTR